MPTLVASTPMPAAPFPGAPQIDVEWAPGSVPGDAPSWRSMVGAAGDRVRGFTIKVGRQKELDEFVPGTATVTFENWSDQYDPDNSTSPVYGGVTPDRQLRIVARDVNGNTYYPFQGFIDNWPEESTWPVDKIFTLSATSGEMIAAQSTLPHSMFEFALRQIGLPDHWWPCDDATGAQVITDRGTASPTNATPRSASLGAAGLVPFDGGRSCASFVQSVTATGIVSGYTITPSSGMTVAVSSGVAEFSGVAAVYGGGTFTLAPADTVFGTSRFDLLVVHNDGSVAVVQGTPAVYQFLVAPTVPAAPSGTLAIGHVFVGFNVSSINAGNITDDRVLVPSLGGADIIVPAAPWPQSTNAWTVGLWFSAQPVGATTMAVCTIGGVNGLVQQELDIWIDFGLSAGQLEVNYNATSLDLSAFWASGTVRYDNSQPHFVVVTLSSDHRVRTYVDGILVNTSNDLTGKLAGFGNGAYSFGSYWNAGLGTANAWYLNGAVQHMFTYDNFALSTQNVTDLYQAGLAGLAGENTGARVNRILDVIGWPVQQRSVQTGSSMLAGADLQYTYANDYLRSLADTELGRNYCDGQGNYVWQSRSDTVTNSRAQTSQATFTDQPGNGLQYARLQYEQNNQYIINRADYTRQGGATQSATDPVSIRQHRERTLLRTVLFESDVDTLSAAQWTVTKRSVAQSRITALDFEPFADTTLTATLLGLRLGDRVTVVRRVRSGASNSTDYAIEGIEDSFQSQGGTWSWVRTLRVWQADVTTYGIWDTSTWDNAVWAF